MSKRILIIEDEADVGRLVELNFSDAGYSVALEADGSDGLRRALAEPWDLIVLDLMLPGVDGLEICRRLRSEAVETPMLMLTAKSGELDRVLGLELGADDYLTKPFSVRELLARVKAIFRRMETMQRNSESPDTEILRIADLSIETPKRRVLRGGREITLTAKEYDLLMQFARHPGRVYSRAELLDLVWGYGHSGYDHTVNSHINRLRAKLETEPDAPALILTVWGVGYKFSDGRD